MSSLSRVVVRLLHVHYTCVLLETCAFCILYYYLTCDGWHQGCMSTYRTYQGRIPRSLHQQILTFHVARIKCLVHFSNFNLPLLRCSRIKTQLVLMSVKSIHLPRAHYQETTAERTLTMMPLPFQ